MNEVIASLRSTSDGWRAIIAEEFTFTNVKRIAWTLGCYLGEKNEDASQEKKVLIAHDTRFMGEVFARLVGKTLNAQGITCHLVESPIPTPVLSWYTYNQKYDMGVMITASHNPPYYNGIKIRMPYGGPPDKSFMDMLEGFIPNHPPLLGEDDVEMTTVNPRPLYVETIRGLIDIRAIDRAAPIIAVDSMHGTTANLLAEILSGTRAKVVQINANPDPLFGGRAPEPKPSTVDTLLDVVKSKNCDFGIAHDGDGDRIVAVDPLRGYLSPHDLITLLAYDLADRRKLPGCIVASVSTTRRVCAVAEMMGIPYIEVPIGFRNAAQLMREQTVLIAGEENGGIGVGFHLPERDGTLIAALLTELVSVRKVKLGDFLSDLETHIGSAKFIRKDLKISVDPKNIINNFRLHLPELISGVKVVELSERDGIKISLENKSWVLIRAAGTEPLIRIYVESDNTVMCESIAEDVVTQLLMLENKEKVN